MNNGQQNCLLAVYCFIYNVPTLIHLDVQREIVLNTIDLTQYEREREANMHEGEKTSTRVRCGWKLGTLPR